MTEEKIPQEEVPPQTRPDSSFWSPWWVFFLGAYYAALNWWRMGNKRKAIIFLSIAAFLGLLREWAGISNYITQTDFEIARISLVVITLVSVIFRLVLTELTKRDITKFQQSGKIPIPTHWTIIFKFFIAVIVPVIAINFTFYFLPRIYGLCAFPRLQDLVYQVQVANRIGPEKVLLNRNDFGCEWLWLLESTRTESTKGALQTYQYDLSGVYRDSGREGGTRMSIDQRVYLFDGPVTKEQFETFLTRDDIWPSRAVLSDWPLIDIPTDGASVELSEGHCEQEPVKVKDCAVYLVNQTMIVRLSFKGDTGYDRYINLSIQKVAERMLQYPKSP